MWLVIRRYLLVSPFNPLKRLLLKLKSFLVILWVKSYHFFALTLCYLDFLFVKIHHLLKGREIFWKRWSGKPWFSIKFLGKLPECSEKHLYCNATLCAHPEGKQRPGPSMCMRDCPLTGQQLAGGCMQHYQDRQQRADRRRGAAQPPRKGQGVCLGFLRLALLIWHTAGQRRFKNWASCMRSVTLALDFTACGRRNSYWLEGLVFLQKDYTEQIYSSVSNFTQSHWILGSC